MKVIIFSAILSVFTLIGRSQTKQEIQDYFDEIAYQGEYGTGCNCTTKWHGDVKMYLDGSYSNQDLQFVKDVITEINSILTNNQIKIVTEKSQSNSILYFGDYSSFNSNYLKMEDDYSTADGLAVIYPSILEGLIDNTKIFISSTATGVMRKHAILEEITQSLGLANDSMKYPDSIFYNGDSYITSLSKMDKGVIKMLYDESYVKRD